MAWWWPWHGDGCRRGAVGRPHRLLCPDRLSTFEKFIDELGGIHLLPPEEITVDPIGPGNTVVLKAKPQLLDGPTALAYARARSTEGGDFDRADRQQRVILSIRDRIIDLGVTAMIAKAPQIYADLEQVFTPTCPWKTPSGWVCWRSKSQSKNTSAARLPHPRSVTFCQITRWHPGYP